MLIFFIYLFGGNLYDWPQNPFVYSETNDNKYSFRMNDINFKKFNFIYILIIIGIIALIVFLLLESKYHKQQKYFRDLYDDPNYSIYKYYSKEEKEKFNKKRKEKEKEKNFKFNKKHDLTYRWIQYSKDMISEEFPCKDNICQYNTEGFIVSESSGNESKDTWNPPKGIIKNGVNINETWSGAKLFQSS